jgi:hypothetical protein
MDPNPVPPVPDAGMPPNPAPIDAGSAPSVPPDPVPIDTGPSDDPVVDQCPRDDAKLEPGECGCGQSDVDTDADGVADCNDACQEDPHKTEPGACGCGVPDVDADNDQLFDCEDECPTDAAKSQPGVCGCNVVESLDDGDEDGTPDCVDACPDGEVVSVAHVCGCGLSDDPTDSDGDGTPDCVDLCPADADKIEPGSCGCGNPEAIDDMDGDGTMDCFDGCQLDANKTEPLVCGCGVPEDASDDDGDGTPNCLDGCQLDANKTEPLVCGCGVAENVEDLDGDGVPYCLDGCPEDAAKASAGSCGCGVAESPHCATLKAALVTRYGFNGTDASIVDSIGGKDGTAVNATQSGQGYLALSGGTSDQYVDLPNNLLSGLSNATFEVWFGWSGGNDWQRVFDFGSSNQPEGTQGAGQSFLYLNCAPAPRVGFRANGTEVNILSPIATSTSALTHVAVVFDDAGDAIYLYVDGAEQGSVATTDSLSSVTYLNNWLGRSQFVGDDDFAGILGEFRIYDFALSAEQVALSYQLGPNPAFLQ